MSSDNTPATIRMAMRGSRNLAKKSFQRDLRATGVSTLVPCSRRLTSTCAEVNPAFLSVVSIILIVCIGLLRNLLADYMLISGKITHNSLTLSAVDIKLMFNSRPVADIRRGVRRSDTKKRVPDVIFIYLKQH